MYRSTKNLSIALLTILAAATVSGCLQSPETAPAEVVSASNDDVIEPVTEEVEGCPQRIRSGDALVATAADLEGLAGVTMITDRLTISRTELVSLAGLECLESVGSLHIVDNEALEDLSALASLEWVRGDLRLEGNDRLADVSGLDALERVAGAVEVTSNAALHDVEGLRSLVSIGADLVLSDNASLESTAGLVELTEVGRDLILRSNTSLGRLGLDSLMSIGGRLLIVENPSLPSCEIEQLGGELSDHDWNGDAVILGNDDDASCE